MSKMGSNIDGGSLNEDEKAQAHRTSGKKSQLRLQLNWLVMKCVQLNIFRCLVLRIDLQFCGRPPALDELCVPVLVAVMAADREPLLEHGPLGVLLL